MENDKAIECLYDISTDAIYCITTEESETIQTGIKAIEKLEKIEQIVSDYGLTDISLLSDDLTDY